MSPFPSFTHNHHPPLNSLIKDVITVQDKRWYQFVPNLNTLVHHINKIFPFPGQTTLCFADNQTVKKLNWQFRHKNKPTNVLTFEHPDPLLQGGDIILALQTVQKEALHSQKTAFHHVAHLIIHGLLHLQGYDHIFCNEAKEMEMKETFLLYKLGIPNPWKPHALNRST